MFFIFKNFFLIIFLSIIGLLYFLGFTEAGLQTEINLLSQFSGGQITIQNATGTLLSKFNLTHLTYHHPQQNITIQSISFAWRPQGLLLGKFVIDQLSIDTAHIDILKTTTENKSGAISLNLDFNFLNHFLVKQIAIHNLAIQYANTNISLNAILTDKWNANWKINIPNMKTLYSDVSGSFISAGSINGPRLAPAISATLQSKDFSFLQQKIGYLNGKININLQPKTPSQLEFSANNLKIKNYSIKKMDTRIAGNMWRTREALLTKLTMTLTMNTLQKYFFTADFSLPHFTKITDIKQPIIGKIEATTSYLTWLTDFAPQIKDPRGTLKSHIELNGPLSTPTIRANAQLNNGITTIPQLGITLEKINLNAVRDSEETIKLNGSFFSGKGNGQLTGTIDLTKKTFPVAIALQGKNLSVMNLTEYQITASPDIKLMFSENNLQLQGSVTIPHANLDPKDFNSVITLPSEVIFVNQPQATVSLPFSMTMQIALHLGNDIRIDYNNLQAQLSGSLQIMQHPGSLVMANGELYTTQGTYKAYGQTLAIQEGRLIFTGGQLTNPGLNIRAVRTIKTINLNTGTSSFTANSGLQSIYIGADTLTVGVQAQGTLNAPIVTLISNPTGLSQNDILSYLLFGYPQSQISGKQTATLLSALSAVGFNGQSKISGITEKLQHSLGLTELNVASTDIFNPTSGSVVSTTSFVVGKQLGPNLSVHYSIGLFDPISILNLRYQLSKNFAIQSETSSVDNGADLLYEIERE